MPNKFEMSVNESNCLQVLVRMNDWESQYRQELQTRTGRELYFRIAAGCLKSPQSLQLLKLFHVRSTDRAMRQRMREFEERGLIDVSNNTADKRTKRIVPTEIFMRNLSQHLDQLKKLCNGRT